MAIRSVKLIIAYDGADYHGWQIQPGSETVQGLLIEAVSALFGRKVHVHGASRTDAGVSALGQTGLITIDSPIPTENLAKAITDRLPPDIAVLEAEDMPRGFDLINGPASKLYRYTIYTGANRPVLDIRHCWHVPGELNLEAMNKAAQLLVGTKDFKSFASAADRRESTVRTIFRCDVTASIPEPEPPRKEGFQNSNTQNTLYENDWLHIDIEGDGFLYNMVRNIAGTLVEVGVGRSDAEKMTDILDAKDRTAAGPIAPANGLCLMWIKY